VGAGRREEGHQLSATLEGSPREKSEKEVVNWGADTARQTWNKKGKRTRHRPRVNAACRYSWSEDGEVENHSTDLVEVGRDVSYQKKKYVRNWGARPNRVSIEDIQKENHRTSRTEEGSEAGRTRVNSKGKKVLSKRARGR